MLRKTKILDTAFWKRCVLLAVRKINDALIFIAMMWFWENPITPLITKVLKINTVFVKHFCYAPNIGIVFFVLNCNTLKSDFGCNQKLKVINDWNMLSSKGSQTLHSHAIVTALQRGLLSCVRQYNYRLFTFCNECTYLISFLDTSRINSYTVKSAWLILMHSTTWILPEFKSHNK